MHTAKAHIALCIWPRVLLSCRTRASFTLCAQSSVVLQCVIEIFILCADPRNLVYMLSMHSAHELSIHDKLNGSTSHSCSCRVIFYGYIYMLVVARKSLFGKGKNKFKILIFSLYARAFSISQMFG